MAERPAGRLVVLGKKSVLTRILSSWKKVAETPIEPTPRKQPAPGKPAPARPVVPPVPPIDRFDVRQWLWGPGFVIPGDADHVLGLVKPFGLNPAMSVLDVAARLGGPARAIAEAFGTYVTGLERDPELARRGMEMSVASGMSKRAAISAINPETYELRQGLYDCVLGRQATYAVDDKERFLRVLMQGLKPRGQLLLTELVIDRDAGGDEELAEWMAQQTARPSLWSVAQYTDCLASLGFEIRISEDMTASYRSEILRGWQSLLKRVNLRRLPRSHLHTVVDEAERWMRTILALDAGVLRVYRLYALAVRQRGAGL
jgi:SAM-dependent methyltransferase